METIEALEHYMYKTFHSDFLRRRKEWFHAHGKAATAMWWIPAGQVPALEEAVEKLDYLQIHEVNEKVFDLRNKFPKPSGRVTQQSLQDG